jgi:hypothetical protein
MVYEDGMKYRRLPVHDPESIPPQLRPRGAKARVLNLAKVLLYLEINHPKYVARFKQRVLDSGVSLCRRR